MIKFIDITCEDRFSEVLKFKKSNHPSSGSTTPFSNSLLEEFANELALLDPFPPGNEDDKFDPEAIHKKIEYLLNRDPSTESSPKFDIEIIDHILERFTDEPAHIYSPPPRDDNDDLFTISLLVLPTWSEGLSLSWGVGSLHIWKREWNGIHKVYDDESLPEEDVQEENFKIYSNPLFEFNDEYISSDVNPLFNEVFKDIESEYSYVSNFDEPVLPVTSLPDDNEDECFDPGGDMDEIDAFLGIDVSTDIEDGYHDSEGDILYLESLLIEDTIPNLFLGVFLDHDPKSLNDESDNDDLKNLIKVFDPRIHEKIISPTYVRLPFKDRHYFPLIFVIKIFLPFLTYPMNSLLLFSSESEDTIFDPDISTYSFYFLEPVVSHRSGTFMCFNIYLNILNESPMEICSSTCFVPNITMIWRESS
ncbi:hypothetical protein Tco_0874778 [Tanacetum coccineum]|uniref:Reverse transcriptase domain-containing protein n=1 Tax=Tanacetum coccineum TaxID=301880 RepID=A0ABQ5BQE9_9ASTR